MRCTIRGCPGEYEDRRIAHTVKRRGEIVVIDNVPVEVCSVCGDTLFRSSTVRRLEEIVEARGEAPPARAAPILEFA